MDYFTSVAYRLEQQRSADLARETELLRRLDERGPAPAAAEVPVRHGRLATAWERFLTVAHLGHHPVAH
ncbi:hypothetical protein [Microbacterium sp. 2FI]|uniref:hypothetical protein n=1 Tax=Microbacterium sp. 2FI TaxID=2502193 RepID=UPI00148568D8|nr:hypothetical protein [Microbacterium sp. 2FI]